ITFCHGIGLGWLSPMLPRLQSPEQTPLSFVIDVQEASWLGALISLGGVTGNFCFSFIMNRFGRKVALYGLALPHTCIWFLLYFATSIEWLYVARVCAGLTGGGTFVVLPIFIGEIADNRIRGRLCSFFNLAINTGIMVGFVVAAHVPYHLIPQIVVALPLLYLLLCLRYPETPQQLLRWGDEAAAQRSLKYYCNCSSVALDKDAQKQFEEMRQAIEQQLKQSNGLGLSCADFCKLQHTLSLAITSLLSFAYAGNKRALQAILTGLVLMIGNIFTGTFAFINYMTSIFERVHTQLPPDTNTIIIGAVQILGTLASIYLVDRYGRKLLLIVSFAGSAFGTTAFGIYAFYAEETSVNLSAVSWLPLLLMAIIIFVANVGIISVTMVVLVEVLPPKIRAVATSACLGSLSFFAFTSLKTFPIMMATLGLAATMWCCAAVCALCLFYVVVWLQETKGKSMYE
ncbi:CG14605, partial [Drosophila busckii]